MAGEVVTLDVGGALAFRGQGDLKGKAFGDSACELDTLRTDANNPHAVKLFGDMTPDEVAEAMGTVTRISDAAIRRGVSANGGGAAFAERMIARKADMAARMSRIM